MPDSYETYRRRCAEMFRAQFPEEVEKRHWALADFYSVRDRRLRALIAHAKAHSPWHAERLQGVDPEEVNPTTLSSLPTMSKEDVMSHWDDIVCDRRLTLAVAEEALERAVTGTPSFVLDEFHVVTTSGSSGRRGIFAWDFDGFVTGVLVARRAFKWAEEADGRASSALRPAYIQSAYPGNIGNAVARCFAGPGASGLYLPPWTPLDEMAKRLEEYKPTRLVGFPTVLHSLALEALAGRLHVQPELVQCQAEPLRSETREVLLEAFGAVVMNVYGTSESMNVAVGYPGDTALHLGEDSALLEPLDARGCVVPPGVRSEQLLLTNVINRIMPLIRYELNDEITMLDDDGETHPWPGRRVDVSGRKGDAFRYGERVVLPYAFRSAVSLRGVAEYQVRQTARGADIDVRVSQPVEVQIIKERVSEVLRSAGLDDPAVQVRAVAAIPRVERSGKLRWFVPLDVIGAADRPTLMPTGDAAYRISGP